MPLANSMLYPATNRKQRGIGRVQTPYANTDLTQDDGSLGRSRLRDYMESGTVYGNYGSRTHPVSLSMPRTGMVAQALDQAPQSAEPSQAERQKSLLQRYFGYAAENTPAMRSQARDSLSQEALNEISPSYSPVTGTNPQNFNQEQVAQRKAARQQELAQRRQGVIASAMGQRADRQQRMAGPNMEQSLVAAALNGNPEASRLLALSNQRYGDNLKAALGMGELGNQRYGIDAEVASGEARNKSALEVALATNPPLTEQDKLDALALGAAGTGAGASTLEQYLSTRLRGTGQGTAGASPYIPMPQRSPDGTLPQGALAQALDATSGMAPAAAMQQMQGSGITRGSVAEALGQARPSLGDSLMSSVDNAVAPLESKMPSGLLGAMLTGALGPLGTSRLSRGDRQQRMKETARTRSRLRELLESGQ